MGIAFDAASGSGMTLGYTNTFSHAIGSGSNRLLVVAVAVNITNMCDVSGVSYNGTALTLQGSQIYGNNTIGVRVFYLLEADLPSTGSYNVVVTIPSYSYCSACAMSFSGVAQTSTFGTGVGTSTGGTNTTPSITSATDEVIVDALSFGAETVAAAAGQTQRGSTVYSYDNSGCAVSTKPGATSTTTEWTGANYSSLYAVPIKPAAGAAAPTVTSLDVTSGTTAGGTAVDITGADFVATPTVTFGGTAATSVVRVSATHVTCVTPAHANGAVDVVVTNPDEQSDTLTNGYTYTAVPTPSTGSATFLTRAFATATVIGITSASLAFSGTTSGVTSVLDFPSAPTTASVEFTATTPVLARTIPVSIATPLAFTGTTPILSGNQVAEPTVKALTFTGSNVTRIATHKIDVTIADALTFTGTTSSVNGAALRAPTLGTATFTGLTPTVQSGYVSVTIEPTIAALAFTGSSNDVYVTVIPYLGTAAFTGETPTVFRGLRVTNTLQALTFTGQVPTVSLTTAGDTTIEPTAASLTFSGVAGAVVPMITSLTADQTGTITAGTTITWTVVSEGGDGSAHTYQFERLVGASWTIVQAFSSDNTYDWLSTSGSAQVRASVNYRGSTVATKISTAITVVDLVPTVATGLTFTGLAPSTIQAHIAVIQTATLAWVLQNPTTGTWESLFITPAVGTATFSSAGDPVAYPAKLISLLVGELAFTGSEIGYNRTYRFDPGLQALEFTGTPVQKRPAAETGTSAGQVEIELGGRTAVIRFSIEWLEVGGSKD